MLEFEENWGAAPRRRRLVAALLAAGAVALAAVAAALMARGAASRRGHGEAPPAVPERRLLDAAGVEALARAMESVGATSFVADAGTAALAAGRPGRAVAAETPPATVFGVELRQLRQTVWVVPSDGAATLAALARDAGLRMDAVPLGGRATLFVPPQDLSFSETLARTGIFLDYTRDDASFARFVASDEWVDAQTAALERPTVGQLESLARAAPNSIHLLRYFAGIANQKAGAVVAARIRALSPPRTGQSATFGEMVTWRGARLERDDGGRMSVRHYFEVPPGAGGGLRGCRFSCLFAGTGGEPVEEGGFSFVPGGATVTEFCADTGQAEFSVALPVPDGIAGDGAPWTMSMAVLPADADGDGKALGVCGTGVEITGGRAVADGPLAADAFGAAGPEAEIER